MAVKLTDALREEYGKLFGKMVIREEHTDEIAAIYRRLQTGQRMDDYAFVEEQIGVPWFVVAIIHNLEAGLRTDTHLHNGDPLSARTTHAPAGHPAAGKPPFAWRDSALDALRLKKLDKVKTWDLETIAFSLETYNGFGYRNNFPHVKSPYLWSFSNIYTSGKYIRDHVFSEQAKSDQCGGLVLLRHMMNQDPKIAARLKLGEPPPDDADDDARPGPSAEGPDGIEIPPIGERPADPVPRFPGGYLRRGLENSPHVQLLQRQLKRFGADPGSTDGDFGMVTEFAVKLFQARSADLSGEPLEIDGVVGALTWGALFGPDSIKGDVGPVTPPPQPGTVARTVIEIAGDEVGVREQPLGSNSGPRVDDYVRAAGLDPAGAHPWCMCFAYWCFRETAKRLGGTSLVPQAASVHIAWEKSSALPAPVRVVTAAQARANPLLVVPGMVFFIDTGGGKGHAGIVVKNVNALLQTIEGNTTDVSGSREGIGVFRRNRRKVFDPSFLGFVQYG